jgi:polyphosphate kinase
MNPENDNSMPETPHDSKNARGKRLKPGRFLEHSRILHFAAAMDDPAQGEFFIGSADWMYRNLSKRVEVLTSVLDRKAKEKLGHILDICLHDRRQAWTLSEQGTYSQLSR